MDKKIFQIKTEPLLKYNRRHDRYFVRRDCAGYAECDICAQIMKGPSWVLYPWKFWSRSPSLKVVCRLCKKNKHIAIKRSDCEIQVDSEL